MVITTSTWIFLLQSWIFLLQSLTFLLQCASCLDISTLLPNHRWLRFLDIYCNLRHVYTFTQSQESLDIYIFRFLDIYGKARHHYTFTWKISAAPDGIRTQDPWHYSIIIALYARVIPLDQRGSHRLHTNISFIISHLLTLHLINTLINMLININWFYKYFKIS